MVNFEPLRWGILSTALINTKVLRGAAMTPLADICAVASRTSERAAEFAERWSIPRSYDSYDALLADDSVEAVYIPLPNGLHHQWTMSALRAGKHVLCEKPYSRHPEEVAEAFALASERGLVLSEAYMYRYHPQTRRLHELVADGAIGELRFVNSSFTWPTDAPGDIRLDPDLDGGSLLDVGCYCVSAARLLAGEPTAATADWVIGPTGVEIRMVGSLRFADDVLLHFDSGFHLPDRSYLEVVGTHGSIRVDDPWHCVDAGLHIQIQNEPPRTETIAAANSYRLELDEFAAAVRGQPTSLLTRADAVGQAVALDALYRAAADGQTVSLAIGD
jgi:D-xylose 1-dehydrogenase (NADP+, D-xylono-1,5-lactone-forming)